jgi:hypothetical protein
MHVCRCACVRMCPLAATRRILQNIKSRGLSVPRFHESPSPTASGPRRRRRGGRRESSKTRRVSVVVHHRETLLGGSCPFTTLTGSVLCGWQQRFGTPPQKVGSASGPRDAGYIIQGHQVGPDVAMTDTSILQRQNRTHRRRVKVPFAICTLPAIRTTPPLT